MSSIINYIKKNSKTKRGRRLLILEGVMLAIGIAVILAVLPKNVTIPTYLALLIIGYVLWSIYHIVRYTTNKYLNNKESKE